MAIVRRSAGKITPRRVELKDVPDSVLALWLRVGYRPKIDALIGRLQSGSAAEADRVLARRLYRRDLGLKVEDPTDTYGAGETAEVVLRLLRELQAAVKEQRTDVGTATVVLQLVLPKIGINLSAERLRRALTSRYLPTAACAITLDAGLGERVPPTDPRRRKAAVQRLRNRIGNRKERAKGRW